MGQKVVLVNGQGLCASSMHKKHALAFFEVALFGKIDQARHGFTRVNRCDLLEMNCFEKNKKECGAAAENAQITGSSVCILIVAF